MKNYIRIALLSASLGAVSHAAPFMAVGDGAELFLTGTLGVRFDDNILLASGRPLNPALAPSAANPIQPELDDIIFDVNPGAEITFGKDAQLKGLFNVVYSLTNYTDNDDLNTDLLSSDLVTKFDDGKMKLGFNAGYHELNQNTVDNRGLTRRDVFSIGGDGEIAISELLSASAGLQFVNENYKRRGYTDSEDLSIPLNVFYKWTPKMDISAGYRYREHQVDIGSDSTDHFFNIGGRGEFSPKLTGRLAVGVGTRDPEVGKSDSIFGVDASLAYEFSPKTSLELGVSNDFGTSPQGQEQENFIVNTLVTTKLNTVWSVNGGVNYRQIKYATRSDDYWEGQIGTAYTVSANIEIIGTYIHRKYESNLSASEFKNNVFSIAANFRY